MTEPTTAMASNDDDEPLLNAIVENSTHNNRQYPTGLVTTTMTSNDDDESLLNPIVENSTHNNRQCPTCQGTGLVTTTPGLVALIPFDDVRLKRRHTFLWIVLTIVFCTIIASAVIATILPRAVRLSIKNPIVIDATNDSFRNTTCFQLTFIHQTNIRSDNWVPIHLINLTTSVEHQLVPIGPNAQKIYAHQMYLRPLGTQQTNLTVELEFNTNTMAYRVCQGIFRQMLMFKFQTTLTYADFFLVEFKQQTIYLINMFYVTKENGNLLKILLQKFDEKKLYPFQSKFTTIVFIKNNYRSAFY